MQVIRDLASLRAAMARLRRDGPVALVPTMGALHAGHMALIDAARAAAASVVASVFVNPLQFATSADSTAYPRDEAADLALLAAHGVALAWLPSAATMYPDGFASRIHIAGPALGLEGDARPGHFDGVATVVAKLFSQVQPDTAIFGEKDWQQVQVVRRLVADLDLPVAIATVPVVRDAGGLALSSRNRLLTPLQLETARALPRALFEAARTLAQGEPSPAVLPRTTAQLIGAGLPPDYVILADGPTLLPVTMAAPETRLLAAVRLGGIRLLDSVPVL